MNLKRKLLDEIKEEFGLPSWAEINTSLNRKGEYLNIDAYNNEVAKNFIIQLLEISKLILIYFYTIRGVYYVCTQESLKI